MEFDLIARIRARVATRDDVVLGIGDDAALVVVPSGRQLAVAMDTLNAGVHFPHDTRAADIGWKALAVNLSDLAAMGARPAWCTLSLSLPDADMSWIDAFLDGFLALAALHDVALIGGDTTRGPLSVCVTVHGFIEPGRALRRDGARRGDDVWVSGTLGDAAAGLDHRVAIDAAVPTDGDAGDVRMQADPDARAFLRGRLDRPTPRVALGRALIGIATACIDVSDGLLADLAHVARASDVHVQVDVDALPVSDALRACRDAEDRRALQATGGDDYELCFTASPALRGAIEAVAIAAATPVTRIGVVQAGAGVAAIDGAGQTWQSIRHGYQHFDPVT